MLKQVNLIGVAIAMIVGAVVPVASASAQNYRGGYGYRDGGSYDRSDRSYRGNDRAYRGYDRSYRSRAGDKCNDGDGGTIVGAIAGGLLGNTVAGRGDRVVGTILGGAVGALAGRAIDRSDRPNYCRR